MRIGISSLSLAVGIAVIGCGDSNTKTPDAPMAHPDAAPDAFVPPPLGFTSNEGGEIRLEWIQNQAGVKTARGTAFFYASEDPAVHALPSFPGCVDVRAKDKWPLAQGTIVPRDVGNVIISSQTGSDIVFTRDQPATAPTTCTSTAGTIGSGCDFLGRPHALSYKKLPNATVGHCSVTTTQSCVTTVVPTTCPATETCVAVGDGDTFMPADQKYKITFTGSSTWPAQSFNDISYMPSNWAPVSPVSNATTMLQAGTDLVLTFSPDASTNLPAGYQVNTAVGFTATGFVGPVVLCQMDGTSNTITVPAALVDILRTYGTGAYARQHLTHRFMELTDGTPVAPADRKRVDVLTVWCFNTNWAAAP